MFSVAGMRISSINIVFIVLVIFFRRGKFFFLICHFISHGCWTHDVQCAADDIIGPLKPIKRPHNDDNFFQTVAIRATLDSVAYETPEFIVRDVPYSAIRSVQKTKELIVVCKLEFIYTFPTGNGLNKITRVTKSRL